MRQWYDEHAGRVGSRRKHKIGVAAPKPIPEEQRDDRDKLMKISRKLVYKRDCYTCRYCGQRVVPTEILAGFMKALPKDDRGNYYFDTSAEHKVGHGIVHVFKAVADHGVPHSIGGPTDMENLVTACGGCNYGKSDYTVEQIGIQDPRKRPPAKSDWDGLQSLLPGLKDRSGRSVPFQTDRS
jgi:5-methylcytosine-specific restriction endonuclease McrA